MAEKEYGYLKPKSRDTISVIDERGLVVADLDRRELKKLAAAMKLIVDCEVHIDKEKVGPITLSKQLKARPPAYTASFCGNEMLLTINTMVRLRTFSIDLNWACTVL